MIDENEIVDTLIDTLKSDTELIDILGKFTVKGGKKEPMLIKGLILPDKWGVKESTINIYTVAIDNTSDYGRFYFSVSCRGFDYYTSRNIASKISTLLNRTHINDRIFVMAAYNQTIPPKEVGLDNYNTPVELLVRVR